MEIKDYSEGKQDSHFNGVGSMYGKLVNEQNKQQPKYSWPGEANFDNNPLEGEHRNVQVGP